MSDEEQEIIDDVEPTTEPETEPDPITGETEVEDESEEFDEDIAEVTPEDGDNTEDLRAVTELVTRTVQVGEIITDYSAESLAAYEAAGFTAYAVYDDGTEVQVPWSDVSEPPTLNDVISLEGLDVAMANNQHFWQRATDPDQDGAGTGAFVTDDEQGDFLEAAAQGFPDWGDGTQGTKPWHNLLMNSLGILLRTALNNLVSITRSAIAFFDGTGNQAANVVASFGSGGAQIGKTGESHMELDYHSLRLIDKEGGTYFHVSDLRGADGEVAMTEVFYGPSAWCNLQMLASSILSCTINGVAVGYSAGRVQEGMRVYTQLALDEAPQEDSPATIVYTTESSIAKAYTLGTRASGSAVGAVSYAEGIGVTASNYVSHAEGLYTIASGHASHAEGSETVAADTCSHAQNWGTIAASTNQTALGRYNIADADETYALIIGNGTTSNRSNALTVDWNGKVKMGQILSIHSLPSSSAQIDTSTNNGAASSAVVFGRTEILDKNGTWVSNYGSNTQTNGQTRSYIGCNNMKTDGTMATNYLSIGVNKDGSRYYSVTDPAAFRTALGFGDGTWETQDDTGPAVSVANSSWVKLTQVTLTAGHWLVLVGGYAASNSTGRRGFHLTSASSVTAARFLSTLMAPPSGAALHTVIPYLVNPTANTTYNIFGYQNSGGNLNMSALVRAIHIYTA